jgi:hypothetical protein
MIFAVSQAVDVDAATTTHGRYRFIAAERNQSADRANPRWGGVR